MVTALTNLLAIGIGILFGVALLWIWGAVMPPAGEFFHCFLELSAAIGAAMVLGSALGLLVFVWVDIRKWE